MKRASMKGTSRMDFPSRDWLVSPKRRTEVSDLPLQATLKVFGIPNLHAGHVTSNGANSA